MYRLIMKINSSSCADKIIGKAGTTMIYYFNFDRLEDYHFDHSYPLIILCQRKRHLKKARQK